MKLPEILFKLDQMLSIVNSTDDGINMEDFKLKTMGFSKNDSEFKTVLRKISSDGFIEIDPNDKITAILRPTVMGLSFGGYVAQRNNLVNESFRLDKIEKSQKANRIALTWLTAIVAFGTLIASVYYFLEIKRTCNSYFWFQKP